MSDWQQILDRHMQGMTLGDFIRWINELDCGLTYRTAYNWRRQTAKPHPGILRTIRAVYPPEDLRHKFAQEMLEGA